MPMTSKQLKRLVDRHPFEPLGIKLTSGERYQLHDPRRAVVMSNQMFIALSDREYKFLALGNIESVEVMPPQLPPTMPA